MGKKCKRTLYTVTDERLFKSRDGGETWQDLTPRLEASFGAFGDPVQVAVSPLDSATVFLASEGSSAYALASDDGGRTWRGRKWRSAGHHGTEAGLAVSQTDSSHAFFWVSSSGTAYSYFYAVRTDDAGRSFRSMGRAPGHTDDVGTLYSGDHVSRDGGETWQQMDYGAGVVATEGALAVAYDHVSYDRGRTWHAWPEMAAGQPERDKVVEIDERDSTLFAISPSGLWAYARPGAFATPTEQPEALPDALTLEAYPNPFRERATLAYELPRGRHVRLAVYDVLGRRVRVLVNGRQRAGGHRARFEAESLPAGVYLVRLQAGDRIATRRLTLIQ